MISIFSRAALTAVSVIAIASPAMAHMSFETAISAPGAAFKGVLALPHGCDGAATDTVRITMPEGFYNARPMPKPGWTLETVTGTYATPYDNHGTPMTEGVTQITWSGGALEDGWYDEFVFHGTFGDGLSGEVSFAVEQACGDAVLEWTPVVTLSGETMAHEHGAVGEATVGDLTLSGAFARATLPNAPVGGGYVTITNNGEVADRLIAVQSPFSPDVQIHEMEMVGDVMEMSALPDGLDIPAGETVTLAPGGVHMMFMDISQPFVEGETVPVTLTFEKAGAVEIELSVQGFGASGIEDHPAHEGH